MQQPPDGRAERRHVVGVDHERCVADDLRDVLNDPAEMGKPAGQDALLDRPNAALEYGVDGATDRLQGLVDAAIESIPDCVGREQLRKVIAIEAWEFLSRALTRRAA